jgi:hypothetical protein
LGGGVAAERAGDGGGEQPGCHRVRRAGVRPAGRVEAEGWSRGGPQTISIC